MATNSKLLMGWFCPTPGDTSAFGDPSKTVHPSRELFERIAFAAENAGFDFMLIPVAPVCWEAWITAAYLAGRTSKLKYLVALKPGFIHPVAQAKMIATFDQLTQGRIYLNMIAGLSPQDARAEGQLTDKEARYEQLLEEVSLMKRLWTEKGVEYSGKYYQVHGPTIVPATVNPSGPKFFLGGGSEQALDISAEHSDVHLFWGDYPERIAQQIKELRQRAAKYGRGEEIRFAMRLQIICRETEADAWAAADALIAQASQLGSGNDAEIFKKKTDSAANDRMVELSHTVGRKMTAHLWTGITEVRPGAGVAVVGNPQQVAAQLQEFVDAGCSGFCLSGYPHDEEAERFGRLVMPLLCN
jgi:alkanesulfonate monooxygenase